MGQYTSCTALTFCHRWPHAIHRCSTFENAVNERLLPIPPRPGGLCINPTTSHTQLIHPCLFCRSGLRLCVRLLEHILLQPSNSHHPTTAITTFTTTTTAATTDYYDHHHHRHHHHGRRRRRRYHHYHHRHTKNTSWLMWWR